MSSPVDNHRTGQQLTWHWHRICKMNCGQAHPYLPLFAGTSNMHSDVLSLILGGGRGTRLYPLTMLRSKPAVPIGGKYRLIDIPISNCINSGFNRIYVLTQFLSVSLHRHISNT